MKLSKLIRVNFDITDHILIRYMTFKIQEKNTESSKKMDGI